jgi:pentatricopeptide repeat protein
MPYKDIAAWSAMIIAYVDEEQVDEVRDLFIRARKK